MKKIFAIAVAAAMTLSLAVGASAAAAEEEPVIKRGTAVIDGVLDEAYKYSFALKGLGKEIPGTCTNMEWDNTASADVYFMYDDKNLYYCAQVYDDDVLTKGEDYAMGNNPHANDAFEIKITLDGSLDVWKLGADAYGYAVFGTMADHNRIDYSQFTHAATLTEDGYIVEIEIPCTKGDIDLIESGKLGFLWNINDLDIDGNDGESGNTYAAFPATVANASMPTFYMLSDEEAKVPETADTTAAPVETTAAPEETTAAPEETTAAPEETTAAPEETTAAPAETTAAPDTTAAPAPAPATPVAPATFDASVIAIALTAASGAAFVLASKKR